MAVLHIDISVQIQAVLRITDIEIDIRNYIKQHQSQDYDAVISEDDRWEVFFQLSSMRHSLFNWYEFKEGANLLEIGGGFGALTGLFCDRCKHVATVETSVFRAEAIQERYAERDNLDIYAGRLEDISFDQKFDYIVLAGILEDLNDGQASEKEKLDQILKHIIRLLKPDGIILIAVDNRYGLRYFCGAVDPHFGKPFAGFNRNLEGTDGRSFSKQELINILNDSGLRQQKFYYPFPDYKLPQLIYSDDYLPKGELRERLINYYVDPNSLVAVESDLYDDLLDNHVFEFFANSFLVECAQDSQFSSVLFAAVSTDRGKEHGFATTIQENGTVLKRPLYEEGQRNIRLILENSRELMEHGISVIPQELVNNDIRMPYIHEPTLSDFLSDIVHRDKDLFVKLIDQLYDRILHSSEHVSANLNACCQDHKDEVDFGVILKMAYLDMVPINCFYMDGDLVFFDQEFVRGNFPAKYVLFRGLFYTYIFHPDIEKIVSLQYFKDKYGLMGLWDSFEKTEREFVADNRKYDVYKQFYRWTKIDRKRISHNHKLLLAGEYIGEPEVLEKLQGIHQVQLELLKVLIEICEKYQLRYFAVRGTLLGAIRHQGFIPWDDDIDIAMPRKDYDKLKSIAKIAFREPYFLQTNETDDELFYGSLSRLRNSRTTGIEYSDLGQSGNLGIWIDIMALDYVYKDPLLRSKQLKKIRFYQKLLLTKTYGLDFGGYNGFTLKQRNYYDKLEKMMSRKWLLQQFNKACSMCKKEDAGYLETFTRITQKENVTLIDQHLFESTEHVRFEQINLPAPKGYHHYLSAQIGKDYMQFPPLTQRVPSHAGIFFDNIPYTRFAGTFRNTKNKKFVLFGSGKMFEHYMDNYGQKYSPVFAVDNDSSKWETTKYGIRIKNPQELFNLKKEEFRLLICNTHYREVGEQLERMGIEEYYIYIQDKYWF